MPNQSDIPTMSIGPDFTPLFGFNFHFLFRIDDHGKCRCMWDSEHMKRFTKTKRDDRERTIKFLESEALSESSQ